MAASLCVLAIMGAAGCKGRFALPPDARFVSEIAAGDGFGCARMKDGSLRAWGANESGQLGDGTTTARALSVRVGGVDGGAGFSHVAAGGRHACALQGSSVLCWGANRSGELGDGTTLSKPTPVAASLLGGGAMTALALGDRHTCALAAAGDVVCWGASDAGQLGGASAGAAVLHEATAIAAGGDATCALGRDHTLRCWGRVPGRGVLPVTRMNVSDVSRVALSATHACAVLAWGGVACWGEDEEGELGDGAFTERPEPVGVVGLTVPAIDVAVGRAHSCALLKNGTVHCWGANARSQLADGTTAHRASPGLVNGLFDTQAITAAGDATCVRFTDGSARCWGGLSLPKTAGDVMPVPTEVRW